MKDLHSHILPGVDDGSKSLEQTELMLKSAYDNGVTDIMLTPHFVPDSKFSSPCVVNKNIFDDVKEIAKRYGINVYLGNEVYLTHDIVKYIKKGHIASLNNSRYILFEIPMHQKFNNIKSVFIEVMNLGFRPILAHPERYSAYLDNVDFFEELRDMGVLLQINYPSLLGMYGLRPKRMAKKLLKKGLISFVGSDIHDSSEGKYEAIKKMNNKLKWIVGKDKFEEITELNFDLLVKNEEIF